MDTQQLIAEFLGSEHGGQALQALAGQGIAQEDAQQLLGHAAAAVQEHAADQGAAQTHTGANFLSGLAAGLARGDGFFKSIVDGGEGVITGRVAEALAARAGLDPATASSVAAAATPYVVAFLKQRLG